MGQEVPAWGQGVRGAGTTGVQMRALQGQRQMPRLGWEEWASGPVAESGFQGVRVEPLGQPLGGVVLASGSVGQQEDKAPPVSHSPSRRTWC